MPVMGITPYKMAFAACALTPLTLSTQLSCCHCKRTRCSNLFTITVHTQLAGVNFEVKPDSEGSEIEWDVDTKTLRIPLSAAEGEGLRRTKLVIFTCNKCGEWLWQAAASIDMPLLGYVCLFT